MFGLGKPRSKLGRFIDKEGITQEELAKKSGVSRPTITRLCSGDAFQCTTSTASKLLKAIRQITGKSVNYDDFWTM